MASRTRIQGYSVNTYRLVRKLVRPYVGMLSKDDCEDIIWNHTGYPCFWPDKNITPEENLKKQILEWAQEAAKRKAAGGSIYWDALDEWYQKYKDQLKEMNDEADRSKSSEGNP